MSLSIKNWVVYVRTRSNKPEYQHENFSAKSLVRCDHCLSTRWIDWLWHSPTQGNHDATVAGVQSDEYFSSYARRSVEWTRQRLAAKNRQICAA